MCYKADKQKSNGYSMKEYRFVFILFQKSFVY